MESEENNNPRKKRKKERTKDWESRLREQVYMLRCCSAAQFLMMNLSGVKDNRVVHVLNISGALLFPFTRETSAVCQSGSVMNQAGRPLSSTDPL